MLIIQIVLYVPDLFTANQQPSCYFTYIQQLL